MLPESRSSPVQNSIRVTSRRSLDPVRKPCCWRNRQGEKMHMVTHDNVATKQAKVSFGDRLLNHVANHVGRAGVVEPDWTVTRLIQHLI
jgi:hypothetical protein